MDEWALEAGQNDDYEYGFDYLYEEKENRPTDAAMDADKPEREERWWEEDEDSLLDEVRSGYREISSDDDAAYWQDDEVTDTDEAPTLSYAEILTEIRAEEKEKQETGSQKAKKKLVRDMKAEALLRMESAARSEKEFEAVQKVWDNRDESRERWERLHEVLQGDAPPETVVDYANAVVVPLWRNDPTFRQLQQGNVLDYLFDCPYEMHDLTSKAYLRKIIAETKEEHRELLFFIYLRLFSPQRVAAIRGQTDRNIRKVRDVAIRKLRKKVYKALKEQDKRGSAHFTKQERDFMDEYEAKEGRVNT